MKILKPVLFILLVLALLFVADCVYQRFFGMSDALRTLQAAYDQAVAEAATLQAAADARIAELEHSSAQYVEKIQTYQAEITQSNAIIKTLKGNVSEANATVEVLRTEVQPAIDANPALREFVASLDSAIILRDALIVEQDGQITALTEQGRLKDERFAVQVELTREWMASYERERTLRVQSEEMFRVAERRLKTNNILKYAGAGLAFAAGYLVGK